MEGHSFGVAEPAFGGQLLRLFTAGKNKYTKEVAGRPSQLMQLAVLWARSGSQSSALHGEGVRHSFVICYFFFGHMSFNPVNKDFADNSRQRCCSG
jgi:hypothetical protein